MTAETLGDHGGFLAHREADIGSPGVVQPAVGGGDADGAGNCTAVVKDWSTEAAGANFILVTILGDASLAHPLQLGAKSRRIGDRPFRAGGEPFGRVQELVTFGGRQISENRLAEGGRVQVVAASDASRHPQPVGTLDHIDVHDLGTLADAQVHRFAEALL